MPSPSLLEQVRYIAREGLLPDGTLVSGRIQLWAKNVVLEEDLKNWEEESVALIRECRELIADVKDEISALLNAVNSHHV